MKNNRNEKYELFLRIMIPVPFILGVIGHLQAGYHIGDSLYGTFCYYFVSVYDHAGNPLMEIARWLAPVMTASWLLYSLRGMFYTLRTKLYSYKRDAVAIYCDENSDKAEILRRDIPGAFIVRLDKNRGAFYPYVKHHILMLKEDRLNLEFYSKHADALKYKDVHMKLDTIDSKVLKENNIHFFHIFEHVTARFWREHPILRDVDLRNQKADIAIIGDGELAEKMLLSGLYLNIFYEEQQINYHIFGNWRGSRNNLTKMNTMNSDRIILEDRPWHESLEYLKNFDRIIVATDYDQELIEDLIYDCFRVPIYYYSETDEDPVRFFKVNNIHDYGTISDVMTKAIVMDDESFTLAKELYYITSEHDGSITLEGMNKYKQREWLNLDGESQASYKSIADFFGLYMKLRTEGYDLSDDVFSLTRLEHVRLCRFYFAGRWEYGRPENGQDSNPIMKQSRLLVPYDELDEDDEAMLLQRTVFLVHHFKEMFNDE